MAACSPEDVGLSSAGLRKAFEAYRQKFEDGELPCGVMTVSRKGCLCFIDAFGFSDVEREAPVQKDSIFNVASMTKSVTSVAIMMLHDQGLVDLDCDIGEYLPEYAKANLKVVSSSTEVAPANNCITLRHLLTHTAGLTYGIFNRRREVDSILQSDLATTTNPIEWGASIPPLAFEPGTRFRYGPATSVVGRIVEAVSGKTLDAFFKEHIFDPLGMPDTFYKVPTEKRGRLVTGYMRSDTGDLGAVFLEQDAGTPGFGNLKRCPIATPSNPVVGDSGLKTTPADWHCFSSMLLRGGRYGPDLEHRLLSAKAFGTMTAVATPVLDARSDFCTHHTDDAGGGHNLWNDAMHGGLAHSLIAQVAVSDGNRLGVPRGSFGWEGIHCTKYIVDPANDIAVALFSQVLPCWRYDLLPELLPLVYKSILPGKSRL